MDKNLGEIVSNLGTLDYWENAYNLELNNFKDHGDVGEIWFGKNSSVKIAKSISDLGLNKDADKIIDIGCGNGMSLIDLANCGFKQLTGIDYSKKAIDFAKEILSSKGFSHINLLVVDVTSSIEMSNDFKFKVAHDKGTFDAICLNPDNAKVKKDTYKKNIYNIVENGGYFVITSCNWTKDELIEEFKSYFELIQEIPVKTMSFGGVQGQTITQLIFCKK